MRRHCGPVLSPAITAVTTALFENQSVGRGFSLEMERVKAPPERNFGKAQMLQVN